MTTGLFPGLADWQPAEFLSRLGGAGYTGEVLKEAPSPLRTPYTPTARQAALALLADSTTPFAIATRLFHLGAAVPLQNAMDLFGWTIRDLMDLGLVESNEGSVQATVQIAPHGEEWIATDFPHKQTEREADWVMGVGPSTRQLNHLIPPLDQPHILEAGCGIGWVARQHVRHGATAVATDINPRALALARLNDRLNNVQGITYAEGDFFEAATEFAPFDVIVANPPYILSPGGTRTYCETPDGQTLCESVVSRAADYLKPGGYAIVLLNWIHDTDEDWAEPPLQWLGDTPAQCWLQQTECSSPEQYAWQWVHSDPRLADPASVAAEYKRWLTSYRERQVQRVSLGCCFIRKPLAGEPAWRRTDARQLRGFSPLAGQDIETVMQNETWLRQTEPASDTLLDTQYHPAPGIDADVHMVLREGWRRNVMNLHSPGHLAYGGPIDETVLRLLELLAQGKPARQLVDTLQAKAPPEKHAAIAAEIATLMRNLLAYGLVTR